MVWPPPSVPTFSSMSTDGSFPSLVRNGPVAVIRRGLSSPGLPFIWIDASTFEVGALDRAAEGLVEEVLHVLLVVAAAAGGERQSGEEQDEQGAAHAAQSSWRDRNSVGVRTLENAMGYVKRTALARGRVGGRAGRSGAGRRGDRRRRRARRARVRSGGADARGGGARRAGSAGRRASGVRARTSTRSGRRAVYAGPSPRAAPQAHQQAPTTGAGAPPTCARPRTLRRLGGRAAHSCATCSPPSSRSPCAGGWAPRACPWRSSSSPATASTGRGRPTPRLGDQVSFRGSEILFQYFPGEGLQLHPLSTFKKANHLHGFCEAARADLRRGRAAAHPRRDDRARGEARPRLHRLGVPLLLRRRHARPG